MRKSKFILIMLLGFAFNLLNAQNVEQWRGHDRSGIYSETGLIKEWPAKGPEMLWHFNDLGKGFSSPIILNGLIYITGMEGKAGYIYCLNTQGQLLWKKNYGNEWDVNYPGARTTPTHNNGKLYLLATPALMVCLNATDGSTVWQKDLATLYGSEQLRFGNTESPLVVDDKVICTPGGKTATIVALNKNTGDQIWATNINEEKSSYCSPLLINHNGTQIIVTSIEKHIVGIRPSDGKLLWSHQQTNKHNIHPNTPLYDGKNIYSVTGYGKGSVMLKLSTDGSSVSLGWDNSTLDNQMGGAILINGMLYGSGHNNNKSWQCIDASTGALKYEFNEIRQGAVIYNDGLLYCYSDQTGTISIVKPTETKFELKGSVKVELGSDQHWAHPVIAGGVLYVRHGNALIAYNLKK